MTFDVRTLLRPELANLEPYTPIQPYEVLSRRLGIPVDQLVKLDANENPYGPASAVLETLAEYNYFHIYPDPEQSELRAALSDYTGAPAEQIMVSHGADEMLDYLSRLFLRPGDGIIDCPPTFGMYRFNAGLAGAETVEVWRQENFSVDVAGIERAVESNPDAPLKLLYLTSPNNPTGNWLPDDDLARLLQLPLMVVLDEAYVDFANEPSRVSWVQEYENLVVLRTFSKAAGIAGLRLGYGVCPPWLMDELWKFKQPYNVNVAASIAGLACLQHADQMREAVEKLKAERRRLYAALQGVAYLQPHPSAANFILCTVSDMEGEKLKATLEQQGILVRHYRKPGLENCIRISVGRPDQTDQLLAALRSIR